MKRLLLVLAVAAAHAAMARVCIWRGPATAGDWTLAANWTDESTGEAPAAAPNAGDIAVFAADAEITSPFEIAEGRLVVSNFLNNAVHFKGTISGAGGLDKIGPGAIHLHVANTFVGEFTSTGIADAKWGGGDKRLTGEVVIYDPDAFGQTAGKMDADYASGHGARLTVVGPAQGTEFVIKVPVTLSGDSIQGPGNLYVKNCNLTFKENVKSGARFNFSFENMERLVFEKDATCSGWVTYACYGTAPKMDVWFCDRFALSGTFQYNSSVTVHLGTPTDGRTHGGGNYDLDRLTFEGENALPPTGCTYTLDGSTIWDLNGFNQTIKSFSGFKQGVGNHQITSPRTKEPAQLAFSGNVGEVVYYGRFTGKAGLRWAPTNVAREFVFSNAVSTTLGELAVDAGVVRVKSAAGLPLLSKISVANGATLAVEETATDVGADVLELAVGAKLALDKERAVVVAAASYDGQPLAAGTYDESSEFVTGAGTLVVDPNPVNAWKEDGTGDWNDPERWTRDRVPQAGDRVMISGVANVALTNETAQIQSLTLSGSARLTMTGWDTRIRAAGDVSVEKGCTVTCTGGFTGEPGDSVVKSRVWIECGGDFTLAEGAAIDVAEKGWHGGWKAHRKGCGPGGSNASNGGSHGGLCGLEVAKRTCGVVYDDPFAPIEPGSGGGGGDSVEFGANSQTTSQYGGHGGGAVRIAATGKATVNGTIKADGHGADPTRSWLSHRGGAGGSVWISCSSFAGSYGRITAKGGDANRCVYPEWYWKQPNGNNANADTTSMTGGGGMIRIEYADTAAQAAEPLEGMVISAAAGNLCGDTSSGGADFRLSVANRDKYRGEADLGTLTFTDNAIVDKLLGKGLSGRLVGVSDYTYAGDLVWTNGHVRFAGEGANVTVTGDLTIRNDASRLEVGGMHIVSNRSIVVNVYAGKVLNRLAVAGDFTVTDGAAFDIRAAETNATMRWGGEVVVDGNFTVGANAIVHPWCEVRNLGAPHFEVGGNVTVAATGRIDADRRGGAQGWSTGGFDPFMLSDETTGAIGGHSAGFGVGTARAAAHGGLAGKGVKVTIADPETVSYSTFTSTAVDDEWTAEFPGAGGSSGGYAAAGEGGGLVYIEAEGDIVVNGTVSAAGFCGVEYSGIAYSWNCAGAGAGGGIHLLGRTFSGGEGAVLDVTGGAALTAKGTASGQTDYYYAAPGAGGGRVVIATGGDLVKGGAKIKTIKCADAPEGVSFGGTFKVDGGRSMWTNAGGVKQPADFADYTHFTESYGAAGTVRYVSNIPAPGVLLFIR